MNRGNLMYTVYSTCLIQFIYVLIKNESKKPHTIIFHFANVFCTCINTHLNYKQTNTYVMGFLHLLIIHFVQFYLCLSIFTCLQFGYVYTTITLVGNFIKSSFQAFLFLLTNRPLCIKYCVLYIERFITACRLRRIMKIFQCVYCFPYIVICVFR